MSEDKREDTEQDKWDRSRVKSANREFYDAISGHYEQVDGRRSDTLKRWLRLTLEDLRAKAPGGVLLDIGAGGGVVTSCAEGLFNLRIGLDISQKILAAHSASFDHGVTADVDYLPVSDASVDVITCFATLHHLYSFDSLSSEIARALKPGGIFYSDHDMDATFYDRFKILLAIYRKINNAKAAYKSVCGVIDDELYDLSEWGQDGIDSGALIGNLDSLGFSVEPVFHWYGLGRVTDILFGQKARSKRWAPLVSIRAVKRR
ncbi:MAG TPA: class I SAM-dependent methyltransferase [Nitrospirae bacterium]|nr:class I SAM-dependent methyltransferase [Nitrospirota bacterium]